MDNNTFLAGDGKFIDLTELLLKILRIVRPKEFSVKKKLLGEINELPVPGRGDNSHTCYSK